MNAIPALEPGGFFAARDVDADSVIWGHHSRGSDITIGKHLPAILRQAGFRNSLKSVSADTKSGLEATRAHARITLSLLDGPFGRDIVGKGWADKSMVQRLKECIQAWGEHPDAFFANVHMEVIGWKPGNPLS